MLFSLFVVYNCVYKLQKKQTKHTHSQSLHKTKSTDHYGNRSSGDS